MDKHIYHIIGAASGIGSWFSFHLAKSGHKVFCYDVNAYNDLFGSTKVCEKITVPENKKYEEYKNNFKKDDYVLIAIPEPGLEDLGNHLARFITDCVVVSLTSVQKNSLNIIGNWNISKGFFGCHALFGPTLINPIGQVLALVDFDRKNELMRVFEDDMKDMGLFTACLSVEDHDKMMSVIQVLPHFTYLIIAETISRSIVGKQDQLLEMQTPNFRFLHAFMCRYLRNNTLTTSASIQSSEYAKEMRNKFLDVGHEIANKFDAAGTGGINGIAVHIEEIGKKYTGFHIDEGEKIAKKAVESLSSFENTIYKYYKNEEPFVFYYSNNGEKKIRIVKINKIDVTTVECTESTKIYNKKYAIGLDQNSIANYKMYGLNFRKKVSKFHKRKMFLLEKDALESFWNSQVLTISTKTNIVTSKKFSDSFFEIYLPILVDGLKKCTKNNYFTKDGVEMVHLKIEYLSCKTKQEITDKIQEIVSSI
jgi:prephenate dehydrogenase